MKKSIAAILVFLFIFSPVSAFAAASFALEISAKEVKRGDTLTLSGTVVNDSDEVVIKIVSPKQTVLYIDVLTAVGGVYSKTITIPVSEELAPYGVYTAVAGSGGAQASRTFSVVETIGGGGGVPTPVPTATPSPTTSPGPTASSAPTSVPTLRPSASPSSTPGAGGSGIPANAGKASGSVVQPESGADGQNWVGSEALAAAMKQSGNTVTVDLPAMAGQSGTPLEFPMLSLHELWTSQKNLLIQSGTTSLMFPAGAIPTTADAAARVRLVLNTSLTDEAKSIIQQPLRLKDGYKETGLVLSAVIEKVVGSQVTEIHQMTVPVAITMKLPSEQEKQIQANLAGVYAVNGQDLEYAGGRIQNGTLTFSASHFSYYTLLEYNRKFADLTGHWAESAVKTLAAKHIVTGVDELHYEPGRAITRAEFVSLIMRSVAWNGKAAASDTANPFSDVAEGKYYTEQVAAANGLGIISGYNGKFRPNDRITREEATLALVRASAFFSFPDAVQGEPAFADMKNISSWAVTSVKEAWSRGLIKGDGASFHPKQAVTRAEVAEMMNRLLTDSSL